jgi:hypothetical protein
VIHSSGDEVELPMGAYVKAIRQCYLPKDHPLLPYDDTQWTAAYSQHGMVLIAIKDLYWNLY